jgi:hypothetical protein
MSVVTWALLHPALFSLRFIKPENCYRPAENNKRTPADSRLCPKDAKFLNRKSQPGERGWFHTVTA